MRFFVLILLLCFSHVGVAKVVEYEFNLDTKIVNFTGESVEALAIADQIPGPTIEATVGDVLRVTFHNKMNVDSSIHWHGVLLPNDQDGVPYLTTQPIYANSSFTYEFPVIHAGTYWYHSHTGLQEQRGVYGSIVFHPGQEHIKADYDDVLVFSDWTDESPTQVLANLKGDGDYYALKKDSVQSWLKVLQHGPEAIKNRLYGSLIRMGPMDISDVGYDAFLMNGNHEYQLPQPSKDDTARLRLINAAASSYFNVEFAGGEMTIIAADGMDVEPIKVKRFKIAIAETYDVLVTLPENKRYELRATSEDGTGYASAFIGNGEIVKAPDIPKPNLFLTDHSQHSEHAEHMGMNHSGHHEHGSMQMQHNPNKIIDYMTDYNELKALESTEIKSDLPTRVVKLRLTGNMERFVWSFNNKTLSQADKILIRKGEKVQFELINKTMMHHPVHLHGHFFRVLNGQGEYSPLKHTVNVPPMETVIIEFAANEEKDWFFHCHNLYHMKAGMSRVISYADSTQLTPDILDKITADDAWYFANEVSLYSNMIMADFQASNMENILALEFESDYEHLYEAELVYKRPVTRFFKFYVGLDMERERDERPDDVMVLGVEYMLPLLIEMNLRADSHGDVRLALGSELQLTDRLAFDWEWNTDDEYHLKLDYEINKQISLSAIHHSDYDAGIGLKFGF